MRIINCCVDKYSTAVNDQSAMKLGVYNGVTIVTTSMEAQA